MERAPLWVAASMKARTLSSKYLVYLGQYQLIPILLSEHLPTYRDSPFGCFELVMTAPSKNEHLAQAATELIITSNEIMIPSSIIISMPPAPRAASDGISNVSSGWPPRQLLHSWACRQPSSYKPTLPTACHNSSTDEPPGSISLANWDYMPLLNRRRPDVCHSMHF